MRNPHISVFFCIVLQNISNGPSHRHRPGCGLCCCSQFQMCESSRGWLWTSCRSSQVCVGPDPGPGSCPSRCPTCASCRGWWWSSWTGVCGGTRSRRCCRWLGSVCPGGPCPAPERRWCTTPCTASSLRSSATKANVWPGPLRVKMPEEKWRRYLRFPPSGGLVWERAAGSCRGDGCCWAAAGGDGSEPGSLCSRWVSGPRADHRGGFQTSSPAREREQRWLQSSVSYRRLKTCRRNVAAGVHVLRFCARSLKQNTFF